MAIISVIVGNLIAMIILSFIIYFSIKTFKSKNKTLILSPSNLDRDIYVDNCSTIIDASYTGIQPWVGPSPASWPIGVPQKWEVKLCEDDTHYYARLIYHEYMLWWSWDEPYLLVKLNKSKVGDLHDESERGRVLWDITYNRLHQYDDYHYGLDKPVLQNINGHEVHFGGVRYHYEKYQLLSNEDDQW